MLGSGQVLQIQHAYKQARAKGLDHNSAIEALIKNGWGTKEQIEMAISKTDW